MRSPSTLLQPETLALRHLTARALSGVRTAGYLRKWLVLGTLIGAVAGLGAVLFYDALRLATHLLLTDVGGYTPAGTVGEGGAHAASAFSRPWAIPFVVGGGGLLSGLLVFGLAPEAEGHGTDAAIHAVHTNPKGIRPRVAAVKLVASALTIGSGGSGGREGPTGQISATFGSVLARALNLTPQDARLCVSSGIASGIGAIFRTPLGGALLGAELLYRDDMEVEALIPSVIASVTSYAVFGLITGGFRPIFGMHAAIGLPHVADLAVCAVVGLVCGLMGRLYATTFYAVAGRWQGLALPRAVKPAVAGLLVGSVGLAVPGVLGTGYGQLQLQLNPRLLLAMPLAAVLALPFAKIVATSMSIGSGGSGGIFGPGMVIGAASGAALWRLMVLVHLPAPSPVVFVVIGMVACFGSVSHAPLAVMLMVVEMTGSLQLLPEAMIAVAAGLLACGEVSIYRAQLARRSDSPAHRFGFGLPASRALPIRQVMASPRLVLADRTSAADALSGLEEAGLPGAPVVNADGEFVGSIQAEQLAEAVRGGDGERVGTLADLEAMTVPSDVGIDAAAEALTASVGGWVTVLDERMRVAGIVSAGDLVRGWQRGVGEASVGMAGAGQSTLVLQERLRPGAPADGRTLADVDLPAGTVVLSLVRDSGVIFPRADARLEAGDVVTALARPDSAASVRLALTGRATGPPAPVAGAG